MRIPVFQANHRPQKLYDYRAVQQANGSNTGWEWSRVRRRWLMQHPQCAQCGLAAEHVHHIVPRHVAPERTLDYSNLMSLCARCHAEIHASEGTKPRF